jgi:hypothetical protein
MLEIRQTPLTRGAGVKKLDDFLNVVDTIYKDDPVYVRPLDQEVRDRLNPKRNPLFEHAEGCLFTAYRDGIPVGRITAQIDHEHLARYEDDTGFFGFFDTIEDDEVARELLGRAEAWLRSKGMKRARGPYSLSINEELGCLVEGFEHPPMVMMPHHRPYQATLIERAGYTKEKDLFAWRYAVGELNPRTRRAHEEVQALPEVTCREFSLKHIERDTQICVDIFNDAWEDNWGFVPPTAAEVRKMAADFKLILMPEITRICFIEGEPAAVAIALPNLNELIGDLDGKLFPFGLAKLLYRLKVAGPKSGRMMVLGIRKKFRTMKKYGGLSAYLYAEMNNSGRDMGMTWGELGWTLEDNGRMNVAIRALGGELYKKYRVYSKELAVWK